MQAFWTGFLTGVPLMIAVGPIALLLIQTGVSRGFASAWPAAVGVACADLTYATVSALGGASLQRLLRPVAPVLPYVAFVVLIVLAGLMLHRAVTALRRASPTATRSAAEAISGDHLGGAELADDLIAHPRQGLRLVASMFALTVMNPMTILAFTSVVVASGKPAAVPGWPIGIATASFTVHMTLVALGSRIRHNLPERGASWLQVIGSVAIAAMATNLVIAG